MMVEKENENSKSGADGILKRDIKQSIFIWPINNSRWNVRNKRV